MAKYVVTCYETRELSAIIEVKSGEIVEDKIHELTKKDFVVTKELAIDFDTICTKKLAN